DGTPFAARDLAIFLAAGVIILSLTASSVLLPPLLRGLAALGEPAKEAEIDRARVKAAEAAIPAIEAALHRMAKGHADADIYAEAGARVMELYRRRIEGSAACESAMRLRRVDRIEAHLRVAGLRAEREVLFALARVHEISDQTARELVREIDLQEERIQGSERAATRQIGEQRGNR